MYKGKFSNNQGGRSTADLLQERASQTSPKMPNPAAGRRPVPPRSGEPDILRNPQEEELHSQPIPGGEAVSGQSADPMAPQGVRPIPPQGARPMPPQGARPMPPQGARPMPPQGARPMPPQGARPVPPQGARPVPPQGARPMPPQGARPMPPQGARPVPPQNGKPAAPRNEKPASQAKVPNAAPAAKKRSVFYYYYFGFIFVFCLITVFGLVWLKGWLTDYEAAQPFKMAEAVFQAYFAHPNWGALYDNSVTKGTDLEGKEAYVSHMIDKVGSSQLTYQETSAGLSGDKKYFIKLGDEKIASFVLKGDAKHITDIPNWELGDIELIFKYDNSYKIKLLEGHKAFVNDMELDESYTIMKASTVAQDFLPVGTTGIRMWTQQIDNLMGKPKVKIVNEKGEEMPIIYDEETMTFTEQTPANSITEEQRTAAIGAAEAYGKYMISQANRGELAKYFDPSSDIYNTIRTSEKIVQQSFFKSYDFGEESVSDFCMYSDDLFSVHVSVIMNVTRKDDTIKQYPIDTNLFFSKQSTGKWLAYDMTNEPVLEPVGQVRLTFMNGREQLATGFYDTNATEIDTPLISVPEGKVFSGWTRETVGESGQKVLEVMFTPDETGHVVLPPKTTLEPMVLTALFENAPAEGGAD